MSPHVAPADNENMAVRTEWDRLSLPWQACLEEAWSAYCASTIPIGAVVVDADGRILSRGRNRIDVYWMMKQWLNAHP